MDLARVLERKAVVCDVSPETHLIPFSNWLSKKVPNTVLHHVTLTLLPPLAPLVF